MKKQKGQALILIALAMVALVGMVALAIDGGNAFVSRRRSQNAADAAALAAAYANVQGNSPSTAIANTATKNGYTHNGTTTIITTSTAPVAPADCPDPKHSVGGTDYTVTIQSTTQTWFGGIVGQNSITNKVSATARQCDSHYTPFFWGNAVVGLNDDLSFDANGTAGWIVTGGGIFANGAVGWSSNSCNQSTFPDLTKVGGWDNGTHPCSYLANNTNTVGQGPSSSSDDPAFVNYPDDIRSKMPPNPCLSGGVGLTDPHPNPSKKSTIEYKNGVYCITDLDSKDGVNIVLENATLYVEDQDFDVKFAGGGGFSGTPTVSGVYAGYYLIVDLPANATKNSACNDKNDTPSLVWAGNGLNDLQGTILAPSACVDVRGNSGSFTMKSQIIGYTVLSTGNSNFTVNYKSNQNAQVQAPPTIELLK